ncbi:MAG: POT family MFS transporter [Verrucomicrobia bacterium]|nr:POT family MFS transporter [Verrucomicrobiota bacterium]
MAHSKYNTTPVVTDKMPPGVPYIIGNEAAERFCFYGMRGILVVFMTKYLLDSEGNLDCMTEEVAKGWYHFFMALIYFTPFLGAILSDIFWGKYKTILNLSLVYTVGCAALALDQTRLGLFLGLTLIAIGSGGIKPCVSANVGDQFGSKNAHLLSKVFGWFYFSINAGSLLSMAITPILLQKFGLHWGPRVAFGVPGVFMLAATIIFWLGRFKFVHVPPNGIASFRETFSIANLKIIRNLLWIFLPIPIFWSLFDQSSSAWIFQASRMDLHFLGMELLPAQTHIFNPLLVLIFIPIFNYGLYPTLNKLFRLTPLRKIGIGMFITAVSFLMAALIEHWIVDLQQKPTIWWQVLSYGFLTTSEVMVSITCLEFSYTQAPKKLKSLIMATYYLSVTAGNLFTSLVNFYINDPVTGQNKLGPVEYYIFFAAAMVCANILFVVIATRYKETPQSESLNA